MEHYGAEPPHTHNEISEQMGELDLIIYNQETKMYS